MKKFTKFSKTLLINKLSMAGLELGSSGFWNQPLCHKPVLWPVPNQKPIPSSKVRKPLKASFETGFRNNEAKWLFWQNLFEQCHFKTMTKQPFFFTWNKSFSVYPEGYFRSQNLCKLLVGNKHSIFALGLVTSCCGTSDCMLETCGQSHKQFTLVNYDCRVVLTRKLLILRL